MSGRRNSLIRDCKKTAQIVLWNIYLICGDFICYKKAKIYSKKLNNVENPLLRADFLIIVFPKLCGKRPFQTFIDLAVYPMNYKRKSPLGVPCTPSVGFAASDLPTQTDFSSARFFTAPINFIDSIFLSCFPYSQSWQSCLLQAASDI